MKQYIFKLGCGGNARVSIDGDSFEFEINQYGTDGLDEMNNDVFTTDSKFDFVDRINNYEISEEIKLEITVVAYNG